MKGTSAYSGITTKIRAMQSRLLTEGQFRELASLTSVPSAVHFLKEQPAYHDLFAELDENSLHRGQIEQLLSRAIFVDFQKIYYFANLEQRKMILLLFERYVPLLIKHCLYQVLDEQARESGDIFTHPFFLKNCRLDVAALLDCTSIEALIETLSGSGYDLPLRTVSSSQDPSLLNYEFALDMYYFSRLWKKRDSIFTGKDLEVIERSVGSHLDLLNIQWIYRCKKYFLLSTADITSLLIPISYRLKRPQLRQLVEASTPEELLALLQDTYYGKRYMGLFPEHFVQSGLEQMQKKILNKIYFSDQRNYPYSIAMINSYIYRKESEIAKVVTALEGIRYNLNTNKIIEYITT